MEEKARRQGVYLIYSNEDTRSLFTWGGCPPFRDMDNPENYDYAQWPKENTKNLAEKIILPADYRTTAQNRNNTTVVYWGNGGYSWALPYLTGLAVLAWSLNEQ